MAQTDDDERTILSANARFYRAMAAGDMASMREVWAEHDRLACTHPGHAPLVGRGAVMQSWFDILQSPPPIACESPRALLFGDLALVSCIERIGEHVLAASNVFERDGRAWRMVHHHAGPVQDGGLPPPASPGRVH